VQDFRRDGQLRWISAAGRTITDKSGETRRMIGIVQDITGRKQAEAILENSYAMLLKAEKKSRESEEKFREAFQKHMAVKLIIDSETGAIVEANQAATRFYGWTAEEMKKMNISQINTLSPREIRKEMARARKAVNSYYNFRHRTANGNIKDVEVYSSKITSEGKEYFHAIIHDVTQRKRSGKAIEAAEPLGGTKSCFCCNYRYKRKNRIC
jgi:two-component system, cell cycle sensor histidine kinase and response regulator CckA